MKAVLIRAGKEDILPRFFQKADLKQSEIDSAPSFISLTTNLPFLPSFLTTNLFNDRTTRDDCTLKAKRGENRKISSSRLPSVYEIFIYFNNDVCISRRSNLKSPRFRHVFDT